MPREYTEAEVRERFLDYVRAISRYWADLPNQTAQERCDGVAFSIMVALDGETLGLPGFTVSPRPHADDRKFHEERGENWFPGPNPYDVCDIGGSLHELFYKKEQP